MMPAETYSRNLRDRGRLNSDSSTTNVKNLNPASSLSKKISAVGDSSAGIITLMATDKPAGCRSCINLLAEIQQIKNLVRELTTCYSSLKSKMDIISEHSASSVTST